jgi:pseudoazurin
MNKKNAVLVAVIVAAVAVFVVAAVTSVMVDDSKERYGEVSSPEQTSEAVAPKAVKEDEATEAIAQNEVGGVNETVTEHMEDASDAVPETVVEEEVEAAAPMIDELPATPEEAQEMMAEAEAEATAAMEDVVEEATPPAGEGKIHIVTAQGLKYEPMVITIQPGDTVAWENMPTHDTQSIEGLIPEGAEAWHSEMGKNYERTFTVEGIYVYKCTPHIGAGMGGAIIVGKPTNLDAIIAADMKGAEGRLARKAIAAAQAM